MKGTKAVTVKLDTELYQVVSDVSALTGISIRELFSNALRAEAQKIRRNTQLQETLDRMNEFRRVTAG